MKLIFSSLMLAGVVLSGTDTAQQTAFKRADSTTNPQRDFYGAYPGFYRSLYYSDAG